MKNKDAYDICLEEIRAKTSASSRASGKPSRAVSKSDLENMMLTYMNTPDHTVTDYAFGSKDTSGTGEPVGVDKKPSKRYRDSLKPMLRKMGMDKHDVEAIDTIPMDREHAAATLDLVGHVLHDHVTAGRKYVFPMTEPDETRMEIYTQRAPERVSVGNRFSKDDTDSISVTRERNTLKAKNGVPYWLKGTKDK